MPAVTIWLDGRVVLPTDDRLIFDASRSLKAIPILPCAKAVLFLLWDRLGLQRLPEVEVKFSVLRFERNSRLTATYERKRHFGLGLVGGADYVMLGQRGGNQLAH